MFSKRLLWLSCLALFPLSISAQTKENPVPAQPRRQVRIPLGDRTKVSLADLNVSIVTDPRIIVMTAALNATGFDFEPGNRQISTLRQSLREDLKTIDPSLARRIREYFVSHNKGKNDAAAIAPYLSLALTMNPAPSFSIDTQVEKLPEEVREITDFALLVEEFYRQTKFGTLLPKYVRAFDAVAQTYQPVTATTVANCIQYLHTEPILELPPAYVSRALGNRDDSVTVKSAARVRKFVVIPDLFNASNAVNLRVVRDTYYILISSAVDARRAIRRGYLRFVLDPLVDNQVKEIREIGPSLRRLAESRGEKLSAELKQGNAYLQVSQSLATAVDVRIDCLESLIVRNFPDEKSLVLAHDEENERAIYELSFEYDRGAVLSYHFYDQVKQAEAAGIDIRQFLGPMLQTIKFDLEATRLQDNAQRIDRYKEKREIAARNAAAAAPRIANVDSAVMARLDEADRLVRSGQFEDAQLLLKSIIKDKPNVARAYFGLAEVGSKLAARVEDHDRRDEQLYACVQNYKDAADNASRETEVWLIQKSYVGAGRILEFLGQSSDAAAAYDMALKLGDIPNGAYQEALKAVKARADQKEKPQA